MARFSDSGQVIRQYIKKQLYLRGMSYKHLARKLGTTEIKIKRVMSSQDMKLETLVEIGNVLGFSLTDWLVGDFLSPSQFGYYTKKQEQHLATDPLASLVFLKLAMGRGLEKSRQEAGIAYPVFLQKLKKLDELHLLELWPGEKIKVRIKGPFRFRENGQFMKTLFPQLRDELFAHFRAKFSSITEVSKPGRAGVFRPFELYLTRKSADQFSRNLMSLLGKYRQISHLEIQNGLAVEPVAGIIGLDAFDAWKSVYRRAAKSPAHSE